MSDPRYGLTEKKIFLQNGVQIKNFAKNAETII